MSNGDRQSFLPPTQGAAIGNFPIKIDQLQEALHKPRNLPQRQTDQYLDGQTGLDCRIEIARTAASIASRLSPPIRVGIKPKRR